MISAACCADCCDATCWDCAGTVNNSASTTAVLPAADVDLREIIVYPLRIGLVHADLAFDRIYQFGRIVTDAILKNRFHVLDIGNLLGGVAAHHDNVGLLARL
jgi:hypothetical protein